MSRIEAISVALPLLTAAVQSSLAILLLSRRLYQRIPIFFAYTAFNIVSTVVSVLLYEFASYPPSFYFYWSSNAVSILLGFFIIHEVFRVLFAAYESLVGVGTRVLLVAGLALVVFAVALAGTGQGAETNRLVGSIMVTERSLRCVQAGLLVFLLAFASYFRVRWRPYLLGITVGFIWFASCEIVLTLVHVELGWQRARMIFWFGPPSAYLATLGIWCAFVMKREAVEGPTSAVDVNDLERWNEALRQLLAN